MADQRILYTEEMVGAGHATKADTLNRLARMFLNNDGSPIVGIKDVSVGLSNNGSDAAKDIDLSAGSCFDATLLEPMVLSAILVKQIDAAWAAGTNAGGMDTGSVAASTGYYVWLIKRSDTGVVDALFSLSATSPTMPGAGAYDFKRLIGYVATDSSSNIVAFTNVGDYFGYDEDSIEDVNDAVIVPSNFETGTLSAPANSLAHIHGNHANGSDTQPRLWIRPTSSASGFTSQRNAFMQVHLTVGSGGMTATGWILLDSSSQLEYNGSESSGTTTVSISTMGFTMLTRSNP